jgi:hydrogenase expression/formation protein HypC
MCLAIPAQITQLLESQQAIVNIGGIEKTISTALITQPLSIGDFVIIHVGYALNKLDEAEAMKTLKLMERI